VRIIMPLAVNGVVTGVVLSFAHTIGEFGVVIMVGGNLPGVTRTVSVAIYDDVQALEYARANATALVLVLFSVSVLALVYALNRRVWQVALRP
jgi:molybdate transport system permease protein